MFLLVITIVFLFLVRLRFPSNLSKVQVIRNHYGNEVIKLIQIPVHILLKSHDASFEDFTILLKEGNNFKFHLK